MSTSQVLSLPTGQPASSRPHHVASAVITTALALALGFMGGRFRLGLSAKAFPAD